MKKLKQMFVVAAVLVGSAVGVAAAQGPAPDADRAAMKEHFKAKKAERKAEMLLRFDFNKNGELDDNEKQAMHAERSAKRFDKLDTNRDGVLSKAEFSAGKQARGFGRHHRGHGPHKMKAQ